MASKSILMSIQPKWVAKILNGEMTIEVRKKFPKDYVGWVYIYCTKGKPYLYHYQGACREEYACSNKKVGGTLNGYVVARFWCDKVEEIEIKQQMGWNYPTDDAIFETKTLNPIELLEKSCLDYNTIDIYLGDEGYAIHISKLEVFDNPKELKEFYYFDYKENLKKKQLEMERAKDLAKDFYKKQMQFFDENWQVEKAPQSWCYIEGD